LSDSKGRAAAPRDHYRFKDVAKRQRGQRDSKQEKDKVPRHRSKTANALLSARQQAALADLRAVTKINVDLDMAAGEDGGDLGYRAKVDCPQ